jgi:hypothetical protein
VPQTTPTYQKTGEIDWADIPDEPAVIPAAYEGDTTSISEILLFQKAREIILSDPIAAATKFGIPELSRLDDLPRLEKPLTLKSIFEFYIKHRNPSKDETRKAESFFKEFMKSVGVKTIREVTCDMVHDYKDKYWNEYKERDLSYHWLRGRFTKVKTVLNYSKKNGRTNKNELSRVLEWCKCLSVPADDATEQAQQIERRVFEQRIIFTY